MLCHSRPLSRFNSTSRNNVLRVLHVVAWLIHVAVAKKKKKKLGVKQHREREGVCVSQGWIMNDPLGGAHTDSPHVIKRAQPRLLLLLSTRLTPKPQNGFLFLIWATIKKIRWFATLMTKTKHRCDHQLIPDGLTFNSYTVRCQFLFAHSSANGVMITQFALDEVIWLVPSHPIPSHPPPYVMFSSILTWCSHRRAGILSFFSSVLRIHHRMFFSFFQTVHRCNRALVVLVQRWINKVLKSRKCLMRGLSSEGAKCRIESPPRSPARSGLLTPFFFICAITNYVVLWSGSSRTMSCLCTQV